MKIIYLFVIMLALHSVSFAQNLDPNLRIGAIKVLLKNEKSAEENQKSIREVLTRNHITFDSTHTDSAYFKTIPYVANPKNGYLVTETITWKNNEIEIQSYYTDPLAKVAKKIGIYHPVEYNFYGWTGKIFDNMTNFCKLVGGKVYYINKYKTQKPLHF